MLSECFFLKFFIRPHTDNHVMCKWSIYLSKLAFVMKRSKHGDPELQLTQLSSASHADKSMMLRMTHIVKHSRFLYHCTPVQWDTGGAKALHRGVAWGGVRSQSSWSRPHSRDFCYQEEMLHSFCSKSRRAPAGRKMFRTKFITSCTSDWKEECSVMLCQIILGSKHAVCSNTHNKYIEITSCAF